MMKSSSKNSGNSNMAPPETETTVVMRRSKSGGKINFDFFSPKNRYKKWKNGFNYNLRILSLNCNFFEKNLKIKKI